MGGGESPTEMVDEKPNIGYMEVTHTSTPVSAAQYYSLSALHSMGTPPASSSNLEDLFLLRDYLLTVE